MSASQSLVAGLIGLVVAGAGAVGVYNFATTGCFLGSCSGEKGSETSASPVGLSVGESAPLMPEEEAGDSCCALGDGAVELTSVALETEGKSCDAAEACATGETCEKGSEDAPCCGEGDGCCAAMADKGDAPKSSELITADD